MASSEPKVNDVISSTAAVTPHSLVTEDNVRAALIADKGDAARLAAWKVVDFIKKGDNYACIVSSVEVKYVLDGRNSEVAYVVKLHPMWKSRSAVHDIIFEREANVYLHLVPHMNSILKEIGHRELNFPKCFHASLESGKQSLYLEDLRPRGYKMLGGRRGIDEAHATLVLREMAKLHAASLLLQKKTPDKDFLAQYPHIEKGWYEISRDCEPILNVFKDCVKYAHKIIDKVGGYEKVTVWIDNIAANMLDILYEQLKCGEPKVVCHGDCWINNFLFRYNEAGQPEDAMLVDLQLVRHATPATDLNSLFFTSMTRDVRIHNKETFLDSYYSAFSGIMEDAGQKVPFTKAQLNKDFKDKSVIGVIFGIMFLPLVLYETDDTVDTSKDKNESISSMTNDIREKILAKVNTDPVVKSRFLGIFDDIIEMGFTD